MSGVRRRYHRPRNRARRRHPLGSFRAISRGRELRFAVVRALRAIGEDVLAVSEFQRRSVDEHLMALALAENRILITEDKDFGWRAFAANRDSPGIILIRFPASARATLGSAIQQIVTGYGERLLHSFVVLQPGVVRINARPRGD